MYKFVSPSKVSFNGFTGVYLSLRSFVFQGTIGVSCRPREFSVNVSPNLGSFFGFLYLNSNKRTTSPLLLAFNNWYFTPPTMKLHLFSLHLFIYILLNIIDKCFLVSLKLWHSYLCFYSTIQYDISLSNQSCDCLYHPSICLHHWIYC